MVAMKKILLLTFVLAATLSLMAQDSLYEKLLPSVEQTPYATEVFVTRDSALRLDIYLPDKQNEQHACFLYVHGGGFIGGERTESISHIAPYLLEEGFVIISIDYRLGMKGESDFGILSGMRSFQRSIDMAAEDLLEATGYILRNRLTVGHCTINPNYFITCGSSAGAITVLQADYYLHNEAPFEIHLPDTFRYAGVLSFAGGIFSNHGKIKYLKGKPAPTLLCHGMDDHLVPYGKIQFFNLGIFGSDALAKQFEKYDYPYHIKRYEKLGHEAAARHAYESDLVLGFIHDYVFDQKFLQIDETYYSPYIQHWSIGGYKIKDLKKFQ